MALTSITPWNTHWLGDSVSRLLVTHPQPRSAVGYWIDDLVSPPDGQWTVVAGPRQVGKTTGLGHVVRGLLDRGIPAKSIIVVPFDQPTVQQGLGDDLDAAVARFSAQHAPTSDEPLYLLLDEIQEVRQWSKRLKAAWDRHHPRVRVLATGSSALELIRPVQADFPGRIRRQTIHTMKLREVVDAHPDRTKHIPDPQWRRLIETMRQARDAIVSTDAEDDFAERLTDVHQAIHASDPPLDAFLQNVFQEYVLWGGYPRVRPGRTIDAAERRAAFEQAWDAVLARDLASVGVVKTREFALLFRHLASNPGGKFVAAGVARDLGVQHPTVSEWKRVLEDAFLVQQLMPLKPNLRPAKGKDKAYLQDPGWYSHFAGITHAHGLDDPAVVGLLVENVLVDHARRLQFNLTKSRSLPIGYVTEPEVDVAANLGSRWLLMEAKYRANPKRTLNDFATTGSALKVVATRDHFEMPEGQGVFYIPAYLWALLA